MLANARSITLRTNGSSMSSDALPAAVELLRAFDRAMRRGRWRWYVFGAQAAVAYGRPRMTGDVDVTVELGRDTADKLIASLEKHGFGMRFPLDQAFLAKARLLPLVHEPSAMPVDVVLAQPGLHSEFFDRSRRVDVGGVTVPLISPEDLVALKLFAARRKDLEDVRGVLLEQWGKIDLEAIESVLTAIEGPERDTKSKRRLSRQLAAVRKMIEPPRRRRSQRT
jgi:Nucleotidyltransferase of unknown function (DUF6036)